MEAGVRSTLREAASRLLSRGALGRWARGIGEGIAVALVLLPARPEHASGRLIVTAGLAVVAVLGLLFSFLWSFLEVLGERRQVSKPEQRAIALIAAVPVAIAFLVLGTGPFARSAAPQERELCRFLRRAIHMGEMGVELFNKTGPYAELHAADRYAEWSNDTGDELHLFSAEWGKVFETIAPPYVDQTAVDHPRAQIAYLKSVQDREGCN